MPNGDYKYGECRVMFGHAWDRVGPVEAGQVRNSWRVMAACDRCGMKRKTVVNGRGDVTSRAYYQPKDYHLAKETNRSTLRLATVLGWKKVK